ncbi:MAG: hypothetical protein HOO89_08210 [Ferruginibacter sp.]|nr:hypothetical protein [Ferruginibacter sp.]
MVNRSNNALFLLIKSLKKSEKRNFKLFANRNAETDNLKTVKLFDALDKMDEYNEILLLKKNAAITKLQLSNISANLYKQILDSLRLIKDSDNIDLQLHEQMDHARILYNKGLYMQALHILEKAKRLAKANNQITYLLQVLFFEKKIEALFLTSSIDTRATEIIDESNIAIAKIDNINTLSNLALKLYSSYIKNGHARTKNEEQEIQKIFNDGLPLNFSEANTFYEKLYYYQCFCWRAFICQDFLTYYRYAQKWIDIFDEEPFMKEIETMHYIKGMHNLMGAHFNLKNTLKLASTITKFEIFSKEEYILNNENNTIQSFIYLFTSKINLHFTQGTFTDGLKIVPELIAKLEEHKMYLDNHRILIFYYKIASLYFGSGDSSTAIDYLNKIINWKVDLRTDLQCYSRLLQLIAHYELGNYSLVEYLIKSVYRFMAKMQNMSIVEEEIFHFLRNSFHVSQKDIKKVLNKLLEKLKSQEENRYEVRAFIYLDVISWIESKLKGVPVENIIREKFLAQKERL